MTRYKVILEYDGTDLIGWQENTQGPSVQSLLRDAIEKFCGVRPDIVGAGRRPMDWKSFVNGLHGAEIKYGE